MSHTSPDQKEADDAPAGPRNPWVIWLVWCILALGLYVLSLGPVVWLVEKHYLPKDILWIYAPLNYLPYAITSHLTEYVRWWRP